MANTAVDIRKHQAAALRELDEEVIAKMLARNWTDPHTRQALIEVHDAITTRIGNGEKP